MTQPKHPLHPIVAVGAVVIHKGKVLLVKRANPPSQGLWAIPGGKIKLGESLQQSAEREIREETGLYIKAGNPIYSFDLIEQINDEIRFHYVIVDVLADYIKGTISASGDAADAKWFSPFEFSSKNFDSNTLQFLNNHHSLFKL